MLGLTNVNPPLPATPDINDFKDTGATAESLALAAQVVAESLAALANAKRGIDALSGGNPAAALGVIAPILRQLRALQNAAGGRMHCFADLPSTSRLRRARYPGCERHQPDGERCRSHDGSGTASTDP